MFILIWLALGQSACQQDPAKAIDTLFSDYSGSGTPGAAVLVIRNGEKVFSKGYGTADLDTRAAVESSTNFRLASITKQFTATAIMLLVEDGLLTLNTRLNELSPTFGEYGSKITIRHLLQHQSGLPDYEPLVPLDATEQVHDRDVLAMMADIEPSDQSL